MAASSAVVPPDDASGRGTDSSKTREIAALTGHRGFAALMVVLVHAGFGSDYPWVGLHTYGPVSLFVLSGFLLYRPWARWLLGAASRPALAVFFRRRLARIFPAYLLVLLTVVIVLPSARPADGHGWLRAVTLTSIYSTEAWLHGLEQTWSLGTELSWYVALPVVALLAGLVFRGRSPRAALLGSALLLCSSVPVTVLWRWWIVHPELGSEPHFVFWLPGYLAAFAGGALLALLIEGERADVFSMARFRELAVGQRWLIAVAVVTSAAGASHWGGPHTFTSSTFSEQMVRFTAVLLLALILLVAAAMGGDRSPLTRLLGARWLVSVGRWSYGLYLWHLPVIVILAEDFSFPRGVDGLLLRLVVVLAISLPLSAATYAWVERPAMTWSRGTGWRGSRRSEEEGSVPSPSRRPVTTTD